MILASVPGGHPCSEGYTMYVCVCLAVTERQIVAAVEAGARNLRDLRQELGITTECSRCARCAHECLRGALRQQDERSAPAMHTGLLLRSNSIQEARP